LLFREANASVILFVKDFFVLVGLWSWSADKLSLHPFVMKLDFYKPTILNVPPPISGITAHATMPSYLEHSIISSDPALIQMNGA
jgi:hypothetical protein